MAQGIAGRDLARLEHGDHVDVGSADADREEAAPAGGVEVSHLIVHDVAAGLPKGLACRDFSRRLALELEEDSPCST